MPDSLPYAPVLEGRTLLDKLNHRIKNELASVINLVTFKAVWSDNVEVKEALGNVVDLLHQHVAVHSILTTPDGDTLLDAGEQLRKLGLAMHRSTLARMNIHLLLSADTLPLESERCWRLALAVYELVTNAVRHACFDSRDGELKIELMRAGSWVNCRVTDNGSGLGRIKLGHGLRIVGDLASSLGGRIDRSSGPIWNSFSLDFPLTQREQRANFVACFGDLQKLHLEILELPRDHFAGVHRDGDLFRSAPQRIPHSVLLHGRSGKTVRPIYRRAQGNRRADPALRQVKVGGTNRYGRDAIASERLDGGAFRALDLAPDDAEFGHHLSPAPARRASLETRIDPWTS